MYLSQEFSLLVLPTQCCPHLFIAHALHFFRHRLALICNAVAQADLLAELTALPGDGVDLLPVDLICLRVAADGGQTLPTIQFLPSVFQSGQLYLDSGPIVPQFRQGADLVPAQQPGLLRNLPQPRQVLLQCRADPSAGLLPPGRKNTQQEAVADIEGLESVKLLFTWLPGTEQATPVGHFARLSL